MTFEEKAEALALNLSGLGYEKAQPWGMVQGNERHGRRLPGSNLYMPVLQDRKRNRNKVLC